MKHLFTLSERLKGRGRGSAISAISATSASAIFCKLVGMVNLFLPFMKATKRQSDTTFFAESLKSLMSIFAESAKSAESAKPIFANRGVKDVRVSLDQSPTNIQRISNLYITPNRYFTRFAAVFALVFVMGVGNVWGAEDDTHDFSQSISQGLNDCATFTNIVISEQTYTIKSVKITYAYNKSNSPSATVKIGETTIGTETFTGTSNLTTYKTLTFSPASPIKGAVTIIHNSGSSCTGKSKGTLKITNVQLVEGASAAPAYTITATRNNDSYGTVSVTGTTITATPNSGYRVMSGTDGYTVTSGSATVVNNGDNTFTVTPSSNCTVQINFESKGCTDHGASSITSEASSGDDYGPIHAYYKYSTSQILYTKSDLDLAAGKKGTIKSIYFEYAGAAAMNARTIKIYMANTALSSLSTSEYVPYSSFTQVYSGTFSCASTGWQEITLDTPFEYNGLGNLVVMVDDNTNSYESDKNFKYHSATGKQIYKRQDDTDIDPASWTPASAIDYRPNTKFCIQEADMTPATVTLMDNGATITEASAGAGVTLPSRTGCAGYTFAGWTKSWVAAQTEWTATAPTIILAGSYTPTANENLYPVYTKTEGGGTSGYSVTRTLTVGKTYIFGAVKAAASPSLANNTTFGAVAFTNTYNSTSPNWGSKVDITPNASGFVAESSTVTAACKWVLQSISDGNYTFKNGNNYIYLGTSKGSTSNGAQCGVSTSSGNMYLEDVNSTCKDAFLCHPASNNDNFMLYNTSNGYRMYSSATFSNTMSPYVRFYEYTPGTITSYISVSNCCTPLAQVNGPVNLSNDDCGAGELKATWKMKATTGIASQVLHVYKASDDSEVTAKKITGITASTEDQTKIISGLEPCTAYYVKVENISNGGSFCGDGWAGEKSASATTKGYTYSFTLTDNHVTKTAGTEKATTCDGNIEYTFEAVSGWVLPEDITVTNADEGWLWDDSEGTLFIDASKVTGNVSVTIEATAAPCEPMVAPSVTATPTYNGATLNWGAVKHASKYKVYIYTNEDVEVEKDENVTSTTYTVSSPLTKQTTYKYRVDAVSEDEASYCSSFKAGTFTTVDYPTVQLYYSENGVLSEGVDQQILTDFTLPNEAAECSKTFIGWTTAANASYSHASTAPDPLYAPGKTDFQIPTNANCTLYAVYADVVEGSASYDKVTSAPVDWSGDYLIVCEEGNVAFNGGLETLDAANNTIPVTISENAIVSNATTDAAKFTIAEMTGGYSILSASGKYISHSKYDNGLSATDIAIANSLSINNDNAVISITYTGGTISLRYNSSSDQNRFRYYKSGQEAIQLYKKNVTEASVTNYVTICQGKVAKPVINGVAEGTTYEEAKTITITSATNGATIYYTTDGTEPTTSSNAYSAPFEVSTNGDYTIRAIAVKEDMVNSDEATAVSFTLDLPFTTIASFIAAAPTNKKLVFTAESNARVLAYNQNRIYIQDGTGAMFLYNTGTNSEGHGKTWASGKKIVGTLTGTYSLTNNMPRMTVTDFGTTDVTEDAIELPTPIAVEALATNFASNVCKLVTINGVSIRSENVAYNKTINMTKSDVTYNIYNAFNALTGHKLPLGTTSCTVTGILGQSNGNTLQLMPISADGISTNGAEAVLPVLSVTGSTNSAEPFEVATNKEITFTPNSNFDAVYAINDEEEAAVTGSSNVTITDEENATKVTIRATREYYTTKEVSYYYRANSALIEYDITKGAMSHGSATIQNAQGDAITYAVGGATVTLVANPAEHYHWVSWEVTAGGEPVTVTNNTFEMPNATVTVSATFEEDDYATVAFAKGNASVTGDAPASQKVYVGENATMPGKGSMILSSHNFAGWKLGSNAVLNAGDAYTVTAADHEAGTITFEAQWEPYPWASAGKWELVTNVDDLSAGDYVVIACNSQNTIAGEISSNFMASVDGTFSGDKNSIASIGDACVLTLGKSGDNWTFTNVDAELLGATAAKNLAWGSGTTTWSISIANAEGEYKATIQNTTSTYGRFLYNSGQPRFTTYTSETNASMILPQLYKFVGGSYYNIVYAKGTEDVVRNMPEGHVTDENGEAAIKENTPIRVGYTFTGWKDQDENVYTYNDGHVYAFTKNVTLTAQWEEQTDKYTVSYDANGSSDAVPAEAAYFENAEVTVAGAVSKEGYVFMGWECNGRVYTAGSRFYMPAADMPMVAMYAHGATYDNMTKVSNVYSIESHDAPEGSEAVFTNSYTTATQLTSGNSMTLTLSGYTGYTIEGVILSMKSNNNDGAGTLNITIDDDAVATHEDASIWYGSYHNGSYENILVSMNPKTVKYGENIVITIAASENSLYCQSFTILYDLLPVEVENTTTIEARDLAAGTAVTIRDGGTLNVNADKTLDNLTVEAGGKVDGSGNLTVNDFTIEGQDGKSGQVMNANKLTINGDAYFDFTLAVSGTKAANQWHNFSVPFPVSVMDGVYNAETGAKLTNEVDYAIEDYHGDLRAQGKYGWKKYRGIMQPGITYSMTVNGDIQTFRFKKVAGAYSFDANPSVGFSQYNSGENTDAGWNGLGNMRLCYASVNNENIKENNGVRYVQILNATEYAYKSYAVGEINLTVGSAFFIQAANNGTMTFAAAHNAPDIVYAPARTEAKRTDKPIAVTLSNENQSDRMYITASEDAKSEYQIGCDLQKMFATNTPQAPMIYSVNYGGIKLAAEEAPIVDNKASYALSLYAPANGTYRIETPTESENADLYLTKDGHVIWNLSMNGYEVELTKGTTEGYGLLLVRKAPSVATGVDEVESQESKAESAEKVIIDEHVYILRGGQMYDVTGKAVK